MGSDEAVDNCGTEAGKVHAASTGKRSPVPATGSGDGTDGRTRSAEGGFAARTLRLPGESLDELALLHDFFDRLGHEADWSERLKLDLLLCCEELLTNTISYGYPEEHQAIPRRIEATVSQETDYVVIELTDNAIPFNPLMSGPPVLTLDLEERPIGGLGVYFVKQIADEIHYEETETGNRLILRKRLV
jgi:serine/threonine-protein kinase RsbW